MSEGYSLIVFADSVILVALGPLTNIAICLKLDPNFGKKLKDCIIMGGNYQGKLLLNYLPQVSVLKS